MKRDRKYLQPDVWHAILHKYILPYRDYGGVRECPPTVIPHKDGEALLNKRFPEYLQTLSVDPSLKIDIYSHGLLLPRKPDFIPFLGSLPNKVRLMVSFHFYNHDGSTNDYAATTKYLRETYLAGMPRNIELIIVSHLIKPMTTQRLEEWKESWRDCISAGLTVHCNAAINPWTGTMEDVATCHYNGCPYGDMGHLFFGATGNVIACCMDLEEEIVFGNVMTHDPAEMIAKVDAFYAEQRRLQETKEKVTHQVCANCFGQKRNDLQQLGVMKA